MASFVVTKREEKIMGQLFSEELAEVAILQNGTYSAAFQVPRWAAFVGIFLPAMDDGAIGIELSTDGTNFYPLLDPADGADLVVCASGSDAGFIDISDFLRFIHSTWYARITCASQTTAAVTVQLAFRG